MGRCLFNVRRHLMYMKGVQDLSLCVDQAGRLQVAEELMCHAFLSSARVLKHELFCVAAKAWLVIPSAMQGHPGSTLGFVGMAPGGKENERKAISDTCRFLTGSKQSKQKNICPSSARC